MQLLHPQFLAFAVLALLPWIGPLRRSASGVDRRHALLRSLSILLVVVALARPVAVDTDTRVHHVLVIDRTESVTDGDDAQAVEALAGLLADVEGSGARASLIEVGGATRTPIEHGADVAWQRLPAPAGDAAALAAAARAVPPGAAARVTFLTDGLGPLDARGSDTRAAVDDLRARGIALDVVELPGLEGDVRAVGLEWRGRLRVGLESTIFAVVTGGGQLVDCVLSSAGQEVARADGVQVTGTTRIPMAFEPERSGFLDAILEVRVVDGSDPRGGDLVLTRTVPVEEPLEVLYLGSRVVGSDKALGDLVGAGFTLRALNQPLASALDRCDLVVLDDEPASGLSDEFQEALVEHVAQRGMGLVAAGGEASFGPGGYHDRPIETLLPVEFVQKEEKRDPSTTLVVIIDTSGSMGGNRVQLAKEVARLAIRRLLPHDKVGLVEFYGAKRWAVPIQPASNSIEIERALNRLDAGGGTVILPAIEEAYYGLKNVRTRYKHVLILTDGGVETGAFEPLLRRMADDGMNVSSVLIGPDAHSEFLVNIANWGQGRFYSVPNRFNLPEILLKQPASAKLPAYRPGIATVRASGGAPWWGDVDPESVPPIAGYVETRLRPGAEPVLETEEENHPVLASWRYGLGRVTAMTTEPTGPGTETWGEWDGYGRMLARVLTRTAADSADPFAYELLRDPAGAVLVAERRAPDLNLVPGARASSDGGESWDDLVFDAVAPDRFEARVSLPPTGRLRVLAQGRLGGESVGRPRLVALDAQAGGALELQSGTGVAALLEAHVRETGGLWRSLADVTKEGLLVAPGEAEGATLLRERAPWLALLALLVYLFDVAYRRWPSRRVTATR